MSQFKSPLVLILIFTAIISVFVSEWTDAIIVLAVVIGSTMMDFVVPGDVVLLSAGSLILADGIVLEANDFWLFRF